MVFELIPKAPKPQMQSNSEAIVYAHTTLKGVQAGLVLGSIGGGLYSFVKLKKLSMPYLSKSITYGIIAFTIISNGMSYGKMSKSTLEQNQSRAYRIERNRTQNAMDNFTLAGLVLGHFVFARFPLISKAGLMKNYAGGLAGFALGGVYNRF